jgi:hypothetical protein
MADIRIYDLEAVIEKQKAKIVSLQARLKAAEMARDHTTEINNRLQAERAGDQQLLFHLEGDNAKLRATLEDVCELSNNSGPFTAIARLNDVNKIARKAITEQKDARDG